MTISEMHQEFKINLDKVDSLNYPDILPEEIDIFLNTNIEKFVSQKAYPNNSREGLEETQKRFDDLLTLITNFAGSPVGTGNEKPNGSTIILPLNYYHAIEEEVDISYFDCNNILTTKRIPVYTLTHSRYNKVIRDPFNKPNENKIWRMGLSGNIELISSPGITLTQYYLRYIRKPAVVSYGSNYVIPTSDVNCDLPIHTHKEIIAMSVADCLEKIESSRTQIANQLLTKIE